MHTATANLSYHALTPTLALPAQNFTSNQAPRRRPHQPQTTSKQQATIFPNVTRKHPYSILHQPSPPTKPSSTSTSVGSGGAQTFLSPPSSYQEFYNWIGSTDKKLPQTFFLLFLSLFPFLNFYLPVLPSVT